MVEKIEKKKLEKVICWVGYLVMPLFFVVMMLLMTMSYEDVMQSNSELNLNVWQILERIYHYIPRLGEFYQHVAVHFMTLQTSLGLDLVFRLVVAAMCWGLFYSMTVFILGRRPGLKYGDMVVYLLTFMALMIPASSEVFTYRFSYLHNYVLAMLVTVLFLLPFRLKVNWHKWWKIAGMVVLGFLFGISTEIAPLAVILIVVGYVVVQMVRWKIRWFDLWVRYRAQLFLVIGLVAGLVFFYIGGGLGGRMGGGSAYGMIYHYISVTEILHNPVYTIYNLLKHCWYNMRYFLPLVPLLAVAIGAELAIHRGKKSLKVKERLTWQVILVIFCVVFMGATSQIAAHDDLLPRFMFPVTVAVAMAVIMFVDDLIAGDYVNAKVLKGCGIASVAVGGVMCADMALAFTIYHVNVKDELEHIHYNPGGDLQIDVFSSEDSVMGASPLFRYKQLPPFDWGGTKYRYLKYGIGVDLPE